jgi:predicted DNA-binding protein
MALLERRDRVEIVAAKLRMPADVLELLEKYAQYLNRDKAEIVAAAIKHAVQLDKDFCREADTPLVNSQRTRGTE